MSAGPNTTPLTRLGPVTLLASPTHRGCSCPQREVCEQPGAHPLYDNWWDTASHDPEEIASWQRRYPDSALGVLVRQDLAVLQVPGRLRQELVHHLGYFSAPPPHLHTDLRSWVWVTAPVALPRTPRQRLPRPEELIVLGSGSWLPVPPAPLPGEPGLRWGAPPSAPVLPRTAVDQLISRLLRRPPAAA